MKIETYKKELKIIDDGYMEKKKRLRHKFAMSNNPYKIGDRIKDRNGKIIINKIQWTEKVSGRIPSQCVYKGMNLTKRGTQNKREPFRNVYQQNIIDSK